MFLEKLFNGLKYIYKKMEKYWIFIISRLDRSRLKRKGIILPEPLPNFNKTLFLDLDETLIHSEPYYEDVEVIEETDNIKIIEINENLKVKVYLRPYRHQFL